MAVFLACGLAISILGAVLGVVTGCVSAIYTDAFNTWTRDTFDVDLFHEGSPQLDDFTILTVRKLS